MSKFIVNYNKKINACIRATEKILNKELAYTADLQSKANIEKWEAHLEKLKGMLDFKQKLAEIENLKKTLIEKNEKITGQATTDEHFCFLEALAVYMVINSCADEKRARFHLWIGGEEEGRRLRQQVGLLYVDTVI